MKSLLTEVRSIRDEIREDAIRKDIAISQLKQTNAADDRRRRAAIRHLLPLESRADLLHFETLLGDVQHKTEYVSISKKVIKIITHTSFNIKE